MFANPIYSLVPKIYKNDSYRQKMSWIESVCGLGLMGGPLLGGILYQYFDYVTSFLAFIVVTMMLVPAC